MKSFISKKKDKKVEKILVKEEIIIPNINIAELDKKFALLEMNNSFLKKNKLSNTQLPTLSIDEKFVTSQGIADTRKETNSAEPDIEFEIDFEDDTSENTTPSLRSDERSSSKGTLTSTKIISEKPQIIPEVTKTKPILKLSNASLQPSKIQSLNLLDFVNKLQTVTDSVDGIKKIEDIIPSLSTIVNKKETSVKLNTSNTLKGKVVKKPGDDFNLKNVVSKLENIGISEHKSFNYNTVIKNESINCNSYNCMYDTSNNSSVSLSNINKENVNCWWCRHSIPENVHLVGCPIKYSRDSNLNSEHFETEGFFCSFNCVLAYNNEVSQHNIRYRESGGLIYLLYKKLFGCYPYQMNIKPAPSWKILKSYGGDMSIQEYRNTFQKVEILSENVIKNKEITCLMPSTMMFVEEKSNIKLSQNEF